MDPFSKEFTFPAYTAGLKGGLGFGICSKWTNSFDSLKCDVCVKGSESKV